MIYILSNLILEILKIVNNVCIKLYIRLLRFIKKKIRKFANDRSFHSTLNLGGARAYKGIKEGSGDPPPEKLL